MSRTAIQEEIIPDTLEKVLTRGLDYELVDGGLIRSMGDRPAVLANQRDGERQVSDWRIF